MLRGFASHELFHQGDTPQQPAAAQGEDQDDQCPQVILPDTCQMILVEIHSGQPGEDHMDIEDVQAMEGNGLCDGIGSGLFQIQHGEKNKGAGAHHQGSQFFILIRQGFPVVVEAAKDHIPLFGSLPLPRA